MNILIVDDEPRHLRGMASMIRAMRPDARVSAAKDGEAALAIVRSELPDAVLSDIQMPNMDGLAFLRLVEEEGIRTKVVMVSAYNLFDYAQTAIRHGAFDYLLKPVDADKVEAVLRRLEQQIAAETKERGESDELKQRLQLASPAYRSRLLHLWLKGELPPDEREALDDWAMLREVDALILTETGSWRHEPDDLPGQLHKLTDELERLGRAFGQSCAFALQTEPNQGVRLVTALRLRQPMQRAGGELRAALLALTKSWQPRLPLSHGIGFATLDAPAPPAQAASLHPDAPALQADKAATYMPNVYRQAQLALSYTFHDEWQGVVDAVELAAPAEAVFRLDGEQLFEALQEPTLTAAEALCRAAFGELANGGRTEPKLMKDYAALTMMKIKSRTRDVVERRLGSVLTETAVSAIPACAGSGTLMELLLLRLSEVQGALTARKQDRSELIVDNCLAWIQDHYREDLTLDMAAERFHFNASYFSTLIKSRTGRPFSDHLTEARMRQAKELLAAGQLKIYEIAERCGYRDTKYFTRMFKKQVGLSPEAFKHTASPQDGNGEAP